LTITLFVSVDLIDYQNRGKVISRIGRVFLWCDKKKKKKKFAPMTIPNIKRHYLLEDL